jgi:hypothetical protein
MIIVVISGNIFAQSKNIGSLVSYMDGFPGGFMITAKNKFEFDPFSWNIESSEDNKVIFLQEVNDSSLDDYKAGIQLVKKSGKISNLAFKSSRGATGPIWNASFEDNKMKSFTKCTIMGCWTVNKSTCQNLVKGRDLKNLENKIETCKELSDALSDRLWIDENLIKENAVDQRRDITTMKKNISHSYLNGKPLFYTRDLANADSVLGSIKDAIFFCKSYFSLKKEPVVKTQKVQSSKVINN